jgi:uncharacterized RDD family membrane protein YckC
VSETARPARFTARFLAFALDGSSLLLAYWGFVGLLTLSGHNPPVIDRWIWAFLFFTAYSAWTGFRLSRSGATPGKRLLGLRVETPSGERTGLLKGALRVWGYLLSSVPFDLGFLWALGEDGRAWHDLLCGTRVVEEEARPAALIDAAAAALAAGLGAAWLWFFVAAPRYHDAACVAAARLAVESLGSLEQSYRAIEGRYTKDVVSLAALSADGGRVLADLDAALDPRAGISIEATADGCRLTARARDSRGTVVTYDAPGSASSTRRSTPGT